MLNLYVQAPFAAFRPFTAGWYRPTATFLTPSAAYGLALNLAGIETRRDDGLSAMTVTQFDLPQARIAMGAVACNPGGDYPTVQTLFQQLHNYPVGASGKERKEDAKGNKYNITPVRREFLSNLRAMIALDFLDRTDIENSIREAVTDAPPNPRRYGLPFLGDNAFLLDKVVALDSPCEAFWFARVDESTPGGLLTRSTRLTIWIDRQDMSRTKSAVYTPEEIATSVIPDSAWTDIYPPTAPNSAVKSARKRKGEAP